MKDTINDQVVDSINGRSVTRGMLLTAFNKVADTENWKNPINSTIDARDQDIVDRAITYFTGSVAKFEWYLPGIRTVKANGYYIDIGA